MLCFKQPSLIFEENFVVPYHLFLEKRFLLPLRESENPFYSHATIVTVPVKLFKLLQSI